MTALWIKTVTTWFLLAALAVANGLFREKFLARNLGETVALPVSGILFCMAIVGVTWLLIPWIGARTALQCAAVGAVWGMMTLGFEAVLGRVVLRRSWPEMMALFDVTRGNLMAIILLVTVAAPYLAARLRGIL